MEGLGATRCRRTARYFGSWAGGGLCEAHALETARREGVRQFHAEHRAVLTELLARDDKRRAAAAG